MKGAGKLLTRTEFSRNVATLMTGSTVAQAIPIIATPILTRIYSPSDFGVLALFVAITAIFGSIANGRYELAILLPENDTDAINIAALGAVISTGLAVLLFVISLLFSGDIAVYLNNEAIELWLYITPLAVWLIGMFNVLNYLNTRKKNYKDLAIAKVYKTTCMVIIQLICGVLKVSYNGLVLGQFVSYLVSNVKLIKITLHKYEFSYISHQRMALVGKRYINFPKYSMWAILCNNLSTHLISFLASIYFSIQTLGMYALAQKILGVPSALIGSAFGQVYFQQATIEMRKTGKAINSFNNAFKKLTLISILVFPIIYIFSESLFIIVFGSEWVISGKYASVLVPFFAIRFVASALSVTNSIFEKQKISLIWQIVLLTLGLTVFSISIVLNLSFYEFLCIFSFTMSVHYFILLYILYRVSKGEL